MGYVRAQRFVCLAPLVDVAVIQERLCWIGHGVSSTARSSSSAARWFKIAVRTVVDAEDAVRLASGSRNLRQRHPQNAPNTRPAITSEPSWV